MSMFADYFTLKLGDVTVKGRRLSLKEIQENRAALIGGTLDAVKCVELIADHVTLENGDKIDPLRIYAGPATQGRRGAGAAGGGTRYCGFYRVALLTGSNPDESAQAAVLREGEKTIGVWLPLALADVVAMLAAVARRAGGYTGGIKMLKRSEILKSWMLPAMSAAIEEDEEEARAFAMLESVRNLKK